MGVIIFVRILIGLGIASWMLAEVGPAAIPYTIALAIIMAIGEKGCGVGVAGAALAISPILLIPGFFFAPGAAFLGGIFICPSLLLMVYGVD